MTTINKKFFEMAQQSANTAVELTTYHAGAFDWDVAMVFLKMAYGVATIAEIEKYNKGVEGYVNS